MGSRRLTDEQRELVARNAGFARYMARKLAHRYPKVRFDDLLSVAHEAMCFAAMDHDPQRAMFTTHAAHKIRGYIKSAVPRLLLGCVHVPNHHLSNCQPHSRNPAHATLATAVLAARYQSIGRHCDPEQPDRSSDFPQADYELLALALETLPERERSIIERTMLGAHPETMADISREWGVCRERIRQIRLQGLARIRRLIRSIREDQAEGSI